MPAFRNPRGATYSPPYTLMRCRQCGLTFAAPRPNEHDLDAFYRATYFRKVNAGDLGYVDYRDLGEPNARRMWHVFADQYLRGQSPGRILDVGCATGGFLDEAAKGGWNCTGLELSEEAAEVARGEFGLTVFRGDLSSTDVSAGPFDVVTMWHVLEHLIDPSAALERARNLLVPGGLLFVELPNWDSAGRLWKGPHWSQIKPPEHINFFTPRSLRSAAGRAGLRVLRAGTAYPSFADEARVHRWTRPFWMAVAVAAAGLSTLGHGGYVRLLATRP